MSKLNLSKFAKCAKLTIAKHSPEILMGIGIAGMITTTVLAVKATPKALKLMEEERNRQEVDKLKPVEVVKVTWKCYIPAVATCALSTACIIGSNTIHTRRTAALAAAYKLSETALTEYQNKVVETIGEKKEEAIRDSIAKDKIANDPVSTKEIIITGTGTTLCYDVISGRYFESDIDKIKRAENNLNKRLMNEMYLSLNEFFDEIGLRPTSLGNELGWNLDDGLLDFHFSSQLSEDGRPCLVVDYHVAPRYNYQKLM